MSHPEPSAAMREKAIAALKHNRLSTWRNQDWLAHALAAQDAESRASEREACAKTGANAVLRIVKASKGWLMWQRSLIREPNAAPKTTRDEVARIVEAAIRARGANDAEMKDVDDDNPNDEVPGA